MKYFTGENFPNYGIWSFVVPKVANFTFPNVPPINYKVAISVFSLMFKISSQNVHYLLHNTSFIRKVNIHGLLHSANFSKSPVVLE